MERKKGLINAKDGRTSKRRSESNVYSSVVETNDTATTVSQTIVTTETVVRQQMTSDHSPYKYEEDPWERSPKTDYTYSKSGSYIEQLPQDDYITPNMSRPSLRYSTGTGQSSMFSSTSYGTENEDGFSRKNNTTLKSSRSLRSSDTTDTLMKRGSRRSQALMEIHESDERLRMPSTTQMENMTQTDKTYSLHLYGTDSSSTRRKCEQTSTIKDEKSYLRIFSTIIVTVVSLCWSIVKSPFTSICTMISDMNQSLQSSQYVRSTKRKREIATSSTSQTQSSTSSSSTLYSVFVTWPTKFIGFVERFGRTVLHTAVAILTLGFVRLDQAAVAASNTADSVDSYVLSRSASIGRTNSRLCCWSLLLLLILLGAYGGYLCMCSSPDTLVHGMAGFLAFLSNFTRSKNSSDSFVILPKDEAVIKEGMGGSGMGGSGAGETGTGGSGAATSSGSGSGGFVAGGSSCGDCATAASFLLLRKDMESEMQNFRKLMTGVESRCNSKLNSHEAALKEFLENRLESLKNTWNNNLLNHKTANDEKVDLLEKNFNETIQIAIASFETEMKALINQRVGSLGDSLQTNTENDAKAEQNAKLEKQETEERMENISAMVQSLSTELANIRLMISTRTESKESTDVDQDKLNAMYQKLTELQSTIDQLKLDYNALSIKMSDYQRGSVDNAKNIKLIKAEIDGYFIKIMAESLSSSPDNTTGLGAFSSWLLTHFVSRDDLDRILDQLSVNISRDINSGIEKKSSETVAEATAAAAAFVAESEKKKVDSEVGHQETHVSGSGGKTVEEADSKSGRCTLCAGIITPEKVKLLILEELELYDADKTGKVDFALETAGGSIINTRCSETYKVRTAQMSVFGIPLWYSYNSPRTVIQPGMLPGQCWPFTGSVGYLVIQLSMVVNITEVSLEHIPKNLAASGDIKSAPKEFTVTGLQTESHTDGTLLGNFTYEENGPPLQMFKIQDTTKGLFRYIEVKILGNHGHPNYTCLYRFRVHGHAVSNGN